MKGNKHNNNNKNSKSNKNAKLQRSLFHSKKNWRKLKWENPIHRENVISTISKLFILCAKL